MSNNAKEHYKMYKSGKKWVFASISVITMLVSGNFMVNDVHADMTDDNSETVDNIDDGNKNYLSKPQITLDSQQIKEDGINSDVLDASHSVAISSDTEVASSAATSSETEVASSAATSSDTEVASSAATSSEIEVASSAATSSETEVASSAATSSKTEVASSAATSSETEVASSVATSSDTEVASSAATSSETEVASSAATSSETEVTSSAATSSLSSAASSTINNKTNNSNKLLSTKVDSQVVSSVHVSDWQGFVNALGNKDVNEIIIDNNILATNSGSKSIAKRNNNTLLIRSNDTGRYAIDFRDAYPKGQLDLTYENIDLYGTVYYGAISTDVFLASNPSKITFKNTSYTGAQLVYASANTTVIFQGKNTMKMVNSYVSPVDGSTVSVSNSQQVLEFTGKNDYIIFDEGSTFEGSTYKDNVIRMTGDSSGITIKKGATVTLIPHDNGDGKNGSAEWSNKANGIFMSGKGVLTIENGGVLNIDAGKDSAQGVAAISITDKNTIVNVNNGAAINISVTGNISSYSGNSQAANTAVYINGQLNLGNDAIFQVNGHDMGSFTGTLVKISGNAKLSHSVFKISLDDATAGDGAIILFEAGGNVIIENPKDFLLHIGNNSNAQWISNGSFSLTKARLKTDQTTTGPFKKISFTVNNGKISVTDADRQSIIGLTQTDETSLISLLNQIGSDENATTLEFVQANEPISIVDNQVSVITNTDGSKTIIGYTDIPGAFIHATVNNKEITGNGLESPYWRENGQDSKVIYAAQSAMTEDPSGKGYKFTFTIPAGDVQQITAGSTIDLFATLNFVDSDQVSGDLGILSVEQMQEALNNARDEAKRHVNQLVNISSGSRENSTSEIDSLIDSAIATITTSSDNGNSWYHQTLNELQGIVETADNRDDALQQLNATIEATITNINNSSLTDDQKGDFAEQIDQIKNSAINDIETVVENEEIVGFRQEAEQSITAIGVAAALQAAKNDATHAIDNAATAAINEINSNASLTADEKADLVGQVNTAANNAKEDIKNAASQDAVNSAQTTGEANITTVSEAAKLQAAKNDGIAKLDEAKDNTIEQIKQSGLSEDRQNELINQVNQAYETAVGNVTQDETVTKVEKDTHDGVNAISDISGTMTSESNALHTAQDTAKEDINEAAETAINAINGNNSLTDDEKHDLIEQIHQAVTDTDTDLDNATTPAEVTEVTQTGRDKIDNISAAAALQAAKNDATHAIDNAATAAINEINSNASLTADEKADLVGQVNTAANNAKEDIKNAASQDAVNSAQTTGEANITTVSEVAKLQAAKNDGIAKLDEAKDNTIEQIKQSGLSEDRQNELINQVNQAYETAVGNVTQDETVTKVEKDTHDGVNAISDISGTVTSESNALHTAQDTAKEDINEAAETAINAINGNNNLTDGEKHDLIEQIHQAVNDANTSLDHATTPTQVNQVIQIGKDTINKVSDDAKLQAAKNAAIAKLENAKLVAINKIKQSGLSKDRQKSLINQVVQIYGDAVNNINNDKTIAQVDKDTQAGINAINNVLNTMSDEMTALHNVQTAAINQINQSANIIINAINHNSSLTDKQKHDLINQITNIVNTTVANIENATDAHRVGSAEHVGQIELAAINNAANLQAAKNNAIGKLDNAKVNAINKIKQSGLNINQQNALINLVNNAYADAINRINSDETVEQVTQDMVNGISAINNILKSLDNVNHSIDDEPSLSDLNESGLPENRTDSVTSGQISGNKDDHYANGIKLPNTSVNNEDNQNSLLVELLGLLSLVSLGGVLRKNKENRKN